MELSDKSSKGRVIASGVIPFAFVILMMVYIFGPGADFPGQNQGQSQRPGLPGQAVLCIFLSWTRRETETLRQEPIKHGRYASCLD